MSEFKDFTIFSVGEKFTHFTGRDFTNQDGCIFEVFHGGQYALIVYLTNMTESEKQMLRFAPIECRIIQDTDYLILAMIQYKHGSTFEISFDPTLYHDGREFDLLKSNLITIFGIESTNNTIQTMRMVSSPMKLFSKWQTTWHKAKEIEDFSARYTRWVNDLDSRYSVNDLWNMGTYVGKMGDK